MLNERGGKIGTGRPVVGCYVYISSDSVYEATIDWNNTSGAFDRNDVTNV